MGELIKVEQSAYTNDIVDSYASNKVGQYSKYLNLFTLNNTSVPSGVTTCI